jgi:hypothetical protein
MAYRICGDDGYRVESFAEMGCNNVEWICRNPWHPRHPGACPKCGSKAKHKLAGMGMKEAACDSCGTLWVPGVPLSG